MVTNLEVIFDNGGGVTVQCDQYVHNFDDPEEAARTFFDLLTGADPGKWDGNEPEYGITPTQLDIESGGYIVYTAQGIGEAGAVCSGWNNIRRFFRELGKDVID